MSHRACEQIAKSDFATSITAGNGPTTDITSARMGRPAPPNCGSRQRYRVEAYLPVPDGRVDVSRSRAATAFSNVSPAFQPFCSAIV